MIHRRCQPRWCTWCQWKSPTSSWASSWTPASSASTTTGAASGPRWRCDRRSSRSPRALRRAGAGAGGGRCVAAGDMRCNVGFLGSGLVLQLEMLVDVFMGT